MTQTDTADVPAPARDVQLRAAPAAGQRRPRRQDRLHRRRRERELWRAGRPREAAGGRPAGAGPQARGARAAADARLRRLAGELSGRDVRRPGAGGGEHTADGRRLRLHAGAQPRAGGAGVGRAAARADGGADQVGPRGGQGDRVAAPGATEGGARRWLTAAPGRGRVRDLPRRADADGQARRHRGRRSGLLAVFVRLHRPPQGHGAFARQPLLDLRAVRQARAGPDRARRVLFGGQAVFCLRAGQRADLPDERGRHRDPDGRTAHARRHLQALDRRHRRERSPPCSTAPPPALPACWPRPTCRRRTT